MFYVYLLASKPYGTLYIGLTDELARRVRSTRLGRRLGAKLPSGTKENAFNAGDAKGAQRTRRRQAPFAAFAYPSRPLR